eukprot:403581_1
MLFVEQVILSLSVLICCVILISEIVKRILINRQTESKTNNIYQKGLNLWSITTIILCVVRTTSLLFFTFPILCLVFNPRYIPSHFDCKVLFTFYQIARLQYCFHHQYNKCLFIILYINGFVLIIWTRLYRMFFTTLKKCDYVVSESKHGTTIMSINILWYFAWDIFVISTYIWNIRKLLKTQPFTQEHSKISKFLLKTMILTVILEIAGFIITIISGLAKSSTYLLIDLVITTFITYLLIEHNNNMYIKIMKLYIKLCCCCTNIIKKTIQPQSDNNTHQSETKTVSTKNSETNTFELEMRHASNQIFMNKINKHTVLKMYKQTEQRGKDLSTIMESTQSKSYLVSERTTTSQLTHLNNFTKNHEKDVNEILITGYIRIISKENLHVNAYATITLLVYLFYQH